MAVNRVIPRRDLNHVEAIIDGYEDWFTATGVIEDVVDALEALNMQTALLDFSGAKMGLYPGDAVEIARFMNSLTQDLLHLVIRLPETGRGQDVIKAFAAEMSTAGHAVQVYDFRGSARMDFDRPLDGRATA